MDNLINDGAPFDIPMARDLGFSPRKLRAMAASGMLRRQFRGIYVDPRMPDSRELRLSGIRLVAPPDAIVCNESASWLFEVDTYKPSEQYLLDPSFVVPHGSTRVTKPGVRCRQANIRGKDVVEIDGVLVTSPLRTTSDLLRRLYRPYALAAADGMAHAGLVRPEAVWEFVAALKGYPGIVQARTLAMLIEPLSASPGESWLRLRIVDAGFPVPTAQIHVVDAYGRERWIDCGYPKLKIGAEYDGREFHTDDLDVDHDDNRRSYMSEVLGWRFIVARKEDVFGTSTRLEDRLGHYLGMPPLPRAWGTRTYEAGRNSLAA